ncbi:MAG: hypothetical protein ACFFCQ_14560 [Promethearchaeota archaeon]
MDLQTRLQELNEDLEILERELKKLLNLSMDACQKDHLRSLLERQISELEIEREELILDKEDEK